METVTLNWTDYRLLIKMIWGEDFKSFEIHGDLVIDDNRISEISIKSCPIYALYSLLQNNVQNPQEAKLSWFPWEFSTSSAVRSVLLLWWVDPPWPLYSWSGIGLGELGLWSLPWVYLLPFIISTSCTGKQNLVAVHNLQLLSLVLHSKSYEFKAIFSEISEKMAVWMWKGFSKSRNYNFNLNNYL